MSDKVYIFSVGKTTVVAGLSWRALGNDPRGETKSVARMLGARYGKLIQESDQRLLVGFLSALAPTKARTAISGAVWLANAIDRPTLYLRSLPTGEFWIVAAEPGKLETRTDRVAMEDEIVHVLDMLLAENVQESEDRRYRIVIDGDRQPSSNMINRTPTERGTFADLVKGTPPSNGERVTQIIGIKPSQVAAILAIAATIAAAVIGWRWIQHLKEQAAFEAQRIALEQQKQIADQMHNEAELRMANAVIAAMKEDTATPPPDEVLQSCLSQVRRLGTELGGWRLIHIECEPNASGLSVNYETSFVANGTFGTNQSLYDAAKSRFAAAPSMDFHGKASLFVAGTAIDPRAPLTPAQAPHFLDVSTAFVTRFQLLRQAYEGLSFTLGQPSPRTCSYIDPAKENTQDPTRFVQVPAERTYRTGTVDLAGHGLWPTNGFSLQWPFFSVRKIELIPGGYDPDDYQWRISGVYVSARS